MEDSIRLGIVGLKGRMGGIRAREIERNPDTELVLGADSAARDGELCHGVPCSTHYRELLRDDLDAVVVCTPNAVTADVVVEALEEGLHVFSEKPPGRSVADVRRMMEAERQNPSCRLKFGFNHRYHSGIREAKRVVDSGKIGEILWLRGVYGKSGSPDFESAWRNSHEVAGGGILLDQGIHMVDLFRHFCGDFVEIKSMVSTAYWDIPVEDNAFALLRDGKGRVAMLHSSSTQWKHRFNLEVYGSEGYVSVNGILSSTRSYGDESITVARKQFDDGFAMGKPREEILYFDTDPSWELELADFVECIREGRPVTTGSSDDALKAMELVFSIYEADPSWRPPASDRADMVDGVRESRLAASE